ncbi:pilus assembly protein TadG-related protein [Streptomyces profundus]|uniref:pilus assembly protein TadG-related protein n=1 Tax=Streptomyces profundus TaxID=2867410 RepID=UPI001D166424|nr:pilus assembly protein TadG-related protein [Streptomyces sp. MA3_2.13]UED86338.1 hypothetical protein K4G22_20835 [Streptomyces sp. MA3_2.13]
MTSVSSRLRQRRRAAAGDEGQITGFVVGIFAGLWLVAGIVIDGGMALAAKTNALNTAQEAARSAAQQLDITALRAEADTRLDEERAQAAALDYVAATGGEATVRVAGDRVTVSVTRQQPTQILRLVGLHQLAVSGEAVASAERGTARTTPEEDR